MKKRILALLLTVFSCMMILGGCGKAKDSKTAFEYDPQKLLASGEQTIQQLWQIKDFSQYKDSSNVSEDLASSFESFESVKNEVGDLVKITNGKISDDGKEVSIDETVQCKNGIANITLVLNNKGSLESFASTKYQTMSEKIELAALNTLIAMSFIFLVLIFISLVIRLIPILTGIIEKRETISEAAPAMRETALTETAVIAAASDGEIAAVIAAAIRAYAEENNVSADGLVVRSIRRHSTSAWKNA